MRQTQTTVTALLLASVFLVRAEQPDWKPIFNGTDLSGWKVPGGNDKHGWFKVENGVLKLKSDPTKTGAILWTEKSYRQYIISFDFKIGPGTVDAGVVIRGDDQIRFGYSESLKEDQIGCLYSSKHKGYLNHMSGVGDKELKRLLRAADWNTMMIQVKEFSPSPDDPAILKGKTTAYAVMMNGVSVHDYFVDGAEVEGPIGIQLHPGKEMEVEFRNIKVTEQK
jgi:hypothetical protein